MGPGFRVWVLGHIFVCYDVNYTGMIFQKFMNHNDPYSNWNCSSSSLGGVPNEIIREFPKIGDPNIVP